MNCQRYGIVFVRVRKSFFGVMLWEGYIDSSSLREKRTLESDDDTEGSIFNKSHKKSKHSHVQEQRKSKVEEIVHALKDNYGKQFTTMQYHIWAEMVAGDLDASACWWSTKHFDVFYSW